MKGCIYLFITKNVYRSWVLVPDMAILRESCDFPLRVCTSGAGGPESAVMRPAGDNSHAGDKLQAEPQPAKQDCTGLCRSAILGSLKKNKKTARLHSKNLNESNPRRDAAKPWLFLILPCFHFPPPGTGRDGAHLVINRAAVPMRLPQLEI